MSESYDKAKHLLDQLIYPPPSHQQQALPLIPLEQQALFSRLQSFTATTWFGKPPGLTPLDCALKGWRNTSPDMLTCDQCGCKVLVKLPTSPVSDSSTGIVRRYIQQLTAGHDALCPQRVSSDQQGPEGQAAPMAALRFPVVPSARLISSYRSRLQDIQRLELTPNIQQAVLSKLARSAVQQLQDAALVKPLAALLQVPVEAVQQATAGTQEAATMRLSTQQAAVLLALCGWQLQPLLPPHMTSSAAAKPASAFAVSHLLPHRRPSSSSQGGAGPSSRSGDSSSSSSRISSAHSVLECELCGCRIGLWRFSCSGPYYAAQLASKAAALVESAAATLQLVASEQAATAAGGAIVVAVGSPQAAADRPRAAATTIAGGPVEVHSVQGLSAMEDQQQQQHEGPSKEGAAAPGTVASSLLHTIAGGELLAPAASGPFGQAAVAGSGVGSGFGLDAGFGRQGSGGMLTSPVRSRPAPFGSPPAPVFGTAAVLASEGQQVQAGAATSSLFGLAGSPAVPASVFDGAKGPSGGAAAALNGSPAPVFGLGALSEEEHRIKRRRSSSGAAAAAPATAAGGGSGGSGIRLSSSPAPRPPAALGPTTAGSTADGGRTAEGATVGFVRQSRLLASTATARDAVVAGCFDPVDQHRSWCPWVNILSPAAVGSSIVPALSLGWSSTLLALQEQMEEEQLQAARQQVEQEATVAGQLGSVPQPGRFETTAAVLAKARQAMDALE